MPRDAAGNNYPVQNASEDTISIYLMTNIVNTENRYFKRYPPTRPAISHQIQVCQEAFSV